MALCSKLGSFQQTGLHMAPPTNQPAQGPSNKSSCTGSLQQTSLHEVPQSNKPAQGASNKPACTCLGSRWYQFDGSGWVGGGGGVVLTQ